MLMTDGGLDEGPVCTSGIDSLDELLSFDPDSVREECIGVKMDHSVEDRMPGNDQRLLLCHDFRGGYLHDRFATPATNSVPDDDYWFQHWQLVDVFVYFSHHLVTIPPVGWINAAHRNGVLVLGTFITEFEPGEGICESLLSDEKKYATAAEKLAEIAARYGFDGWLLNIENKVKVSLLENFKTAFLGSEDVPNNVVKLTKFASAVTDHCKKRLGETSQVIWYDSVTEAGILDWQNALNENNEIFFNACDGIFLNYCWTEEHLATSVGWAEKSAKSPRSVYVGVDCFGRGCPGGGGYDTWKALELIRGNGRLSVAMFAFSWCFEKFGHTAFQENDFRIPQRYTIRNGMHCLRVKAGTDRPLGLRIACLSLSGNSVRSCSVSYSADPGGVPVCIVFGFIDKNGTKSQVRCSPETDVFSGSLSEAATVEDAGSQMTLRACLTENLPLGTITSAELEIGPSPLSEACLYVYRVSID